MRKGLFPLLLLWLLWEPSTAQTPSPAQAAQRFVHYVEPFGLVLIEAIQPGMTLYGLARQYNVSIDSILWANTDLDPHAIPLGYPVNIPIYAGAVSSTAPDQPDESFPLYYRVQPRETLYRISKVYLGKSPDAVIALNPRASAQLSIGEVLLLGWYHPRMNSHSPVTAAAQTVSDTVTFRVRDYAAEYASQGKVMREQKGLAVWKPGNDKTHYFVLHPSAVVGSYMEITNPMLHRTLTAKVAGHIPPGIYPANVGLVVSPSVARALGVLDQQFFARWRFTE